VYYSKFLGNRLVDQQSASDDAESMMISKLKQACGYDYTAKLQRMFQDIELSKGINEDFKRWLTEREGNITVAIDFHIQVLSFGSWPFKESENFAVPSEV